LENALPAFTPVCRPRERVGFATRGSDPDLLRYRGAEPIRAVIAAKAFWRDGYGRLPSQVERPAMSEIGSDKEREFFVTGARTYLDVADAMAEFRRQVQDQCSIVVSRRLDEINRACEMDWTRNALKDYIWPQSDCFHVGNKILVKELGNQGGLYFCLELLRRDDNVVCAALVVLYRERGSLAVDLWVRLRGVRSDTAYSTGNDLIFTRRLSEDKISSFQEYLNRAIDDFIAFINSSGGLKRYLVKG
jgi:hypothetical protein